MSATPDDEVLIRVDGTLGRITLNRPRALNALTLAMVKMVDAALSGWEHDPAVRVVLIDGAGERGLCAGGDIRTLYHALTAGARGDAVAFMTHEYRMNARIAGFPKPYVAFMDGIVMGGGIGVSAHGNMRLVTERSILAMPETSIGLFPDIGGTWLLGPAAPGELGTHLALTSRKFGASDAILVGFADRCVPSSSREALAASLASAADHDQVRATVDRFAVAPPEGALEGQRGWIDRCYAHDEVEAILRALEATPEAAARAAADDIRRNAPTSLKITLRALREARRTPDLLACLEREFAMANQAFVSTDFREGIRAAVVDKDGAPRWSPASLEAVSREAVDRYFVPPAEGLGLAAAGAWT